MALTVNSILKIPADTTNNAVVVEVTIENVGKSALAYSPDYFRLKDKDGFEYRETVLNLNVRRLSFGNLAPGDKVRGDLTFLAPKAAAGLALRYRTDLSIQLDAQ